MTADPWEAKRDEIAKSLIQHHMTQALAYWLADLAIDVERLKRGTMTPTEIAAALRQVQDALIDLGACNNPDCTEPNCNRALSHLPAIIAAVEEQQNTVAGLREDLRQLIRVVLTNPADAAGFVQANYHKECAELAKHA